MINYSGYYYETDEDYPYDSEDLFVNSCGHYKLIHRKEMHTYREEGRRDYQLLYVAGGIAHFVEGNTHYELGAGGIYIYQPQVPQDYYYLLREKPDIYWVHFTGRKAGEILASMGLPLGQPIQLTIREELPELFEKIIVELRLNRYRNADMAESYLRQLLITAARYHNADSGEKQVYNSMFDEIINRFHQEYQNDISVAAYAAEYHISNSWFIREFKKYTGYSPKQYITNLRLQHAKELLNNRYLSISDIATLVGYENQLYFSRIFHKYIGMSPREYRDRDKIINQKGDQVIETIYCNTNG